MNHSADKLTFIMPVSLGNVRPKIVWHNENDYPISVVQLRIAISSIIKFFKQSQLDKIILITRDMDLVNVKLIIAELLSDREINIQIVSELELCPILESTRNEQLTGWHIQQLLKIAVSELVETSFYMTLDIDVLCTRKCDLDTFIFNNKAKTNIQSFHDYVVLYKKPFREQLIKSRRIYNTSTLLKLKRPVRYWGRIYGETPVIFHTKSVRRLREHIGSVHGEDWQVTLTKSSQWTEYPLYFQFLEGTGGLEKYHVVCDRKTILDLDNSIWFPPSKLWNPLNYDNWPSQDSDTSNAPFVVVQTWFDEKCWLPNKNLTLVDFYFDIAKRLKLDVYNHL
jgi:hypothetical protein